METRYFGKEEAELRSKLSEVSRAIIDKGIVKLLQDKQSKRTFAQEIGFDIKKLGL